MSSIRTMVRPTKRLAAGGLPRARRLFIAAVVVVGVFGSDADVTAVGQQAAAVTVDEEDGVYRVEARFAVPQPASTVFAVLTDYDQIPRFMPDVRRSTVLERGSGRAVVEQEANPRFMMFARRVHLVLEVIEEPAAIRFRDLCGRSFSRYEGSWQIDADGKGAAIVYRLDAKPSFDVPEFLLKRLLGRDARQMIERLRLEIAARSREP